MHHTWNRGCTNGFNWLVCFAARCLRSVYAVGLMTTQLLSLKTSTRYTDESWGMDTYTLYWIFWCVPDESKNLDFCFNISMQRKHSIQHLVRDHDPYICQHTSRLRLDFQEDLGLEDSGNNRFIGRTLVLYDKKVPPSTSGVWGLVSCCNFRRKRGSCMKLYG